MVEYLFEWLDNQLRRPDLRPGFLERYRTDSGAFCRRLLLNHIRVAKRDGMDRDEIAELRSRIPTLCEQFARIVEAAVLDDAYGRSPTLN